MPPGEAVGNAANCRSKKSCRLAFEDRSLANASLFPLFDEEGRTGVVMITAEENARIMLADWAADAAAPRSGSRMETAALLAFPLTLPY